MTAMCTQDLDDGEPLEDGSVTAALVLLAIFAVLWLAQTIRHAWRATTR